MLCDALTHLFEVIGSLPPSLASFGDKVKSMNFAALANPPVTLCEAGLYTNGSTRTPSTTTNTGFNAFPVISCAPCPPGSVAPAPGALSCSACPPNTYGAWVCTWERLRGSSLRAVGPNPIRRPPADQTPALSSRPDALCLRLRRWHRLFRMPLRCHLHPWIAARVGLHLQKRLRRRTLLRRKRAGLRRLRGGLVL